MQSINGIRVQNIRCFGSDAPIVPLKSINLLVGKNSSGKSTFARLFPLLRQSIESNTRGPLLWFGDYVDFGDFKSSVNCAIKEEKEIVFEFQMNLAIEGEYDIELQDYDEGVFTRLPVKVSVGVVEQDQKTVASKALFIFENCSVEIKYEQGKVGSIKACLLKYDFIEEFEVEYYSYGGDFIPSLTEKTVFSKRNLKKLFATDELLVVTKSFSSFIKKYHHKKKTDKTIFEVVDSLDVGTEEEIFSSLTTSFRNNKQFSKNLAGKEDYFSKISFLYNVCMHINKYIAAANALIEETFLGVRYLGPIRATAERFYRYQDLQVKEIDHMGSNLPMLINSLSGFDKVLLKQWMQEHFGFWFVEENHGSHYALMVQEEGDEFPHNISDMGFGYSQVLPILISLWLESRTEILSLQKIHHIKERIIVIEQPELHLHPVLQYKFASAVASIIKKSDNSIRFILETHSSHIVEGLGDAVRQKILDKDDVNIVLFEKNPGENSSISFTEFDEGGYLKNWPAGFLSA